MNTTLFYKDAFAVIGKAGEGPATDASWISPLWEAANSHFGEILGVIRKDAAGAPCIWGAMNDITGANKRWDAAGRYMAGCEVDVDAAAPEGWAKWIIPAQTYLLAPCTTQTYGEVFSEVVGIWDERIIATVHERYPQPGNPQILELLFPIASGMLFCQSCGMPITKDEDFATEADASKSLDYCRYCYENGAFITEQTMEEAIESCIPFVVGGNPYADAQEARKAMKGFFPQLKRWKK